jgi:hypothetical protein
MRHGLEKSARPLALAPYPPSLRLRPRLRPRAGLGWAWLASCGLRLRLRAGECGSWGGVARRYVIWLLGAVGCLVLDTLSDYTCDGWCTHHHTTPHLATPHQSTPPLCRSLTCQQFSRWFALYYWTFLCMLTYEFYKIYQVSLSFCLHFPLLSWPDAHPDAQAATGAPLQKQGAAALGMGASSLFAAAIKRFDELRNE